MLKPIFSVLFIVFSTLMLSACNSTPEHSNSAFLAASTKQLDNGFSYTIQPLTDNKQRIQLRLYVKAGSLSETNDQSGYAHFLEHMAFNGTKSFPKNKVIELFEQAGLGLGQDLNAYTSFDSTVYVLSIPSHNEALLKDTLTYLREILTDINLNKEEIEKEKGVVLNEYYLRMPEQKNGELLFFLDYIKGTEYAERLPIGVPDSISGINQQALQAFYQTWYRPNNAKLLIVGAVDTPSVANLVESTFVSATNQSEQQQVVPKAPSLTTQRALFASDVVQVEVTELLFDSGLTMENSAQQLSEIYMQDTVIDLINYRLNAMNQLRDVPFNKVGISKIDLLNEKAITRIYVENGNIISSDPAQFIATEITRIKLHGFSDAEYAQQIELKRSQQSVLPTYYDNRSSAEIAAEIIASWTSGNTLTTLDREQQGYQLYFEQVSPSLIKQQTEMLLASNKKWIYFSGKNNEDNLYLVDNTINKAIASNPAQVDVKIEKLALPSTVALDKEQIIKETIYASEGITQWRLKNGLDVVLQPSTTTKNKVMIHFSAPGGTNSIPSELIPAQHVLLNSYINSGITGISSQALNQKLKSVNASLYPYIEKNASGFDASSVNQAESLSVVFSSIHDAMTNAKLKDSAFSNEKNRFVNEQVKFLSLPYSVTIRKIQQALYPDNPYEAPVSEMHAKAIKKEQVETLYEMLYNSADGAKLTIVGDFTVEQIKPYILQYMATLEKGEKHQFSTQNQPLIQQATELQETNFVQPDTGVVLLQSVNQQDHYTIKEVYRADLVRRVVNQALLKVIREELSLTYTPQVIVAERSRGATSTFSQILIVAQTKDLPQVKKSVQQIIKKLIDEGIDQAMLDLHKMSLAQAMTEMHGQPTDNSWMLNRDHLLGFELGSSKNAQAIVDSITVADMTEAFNLYFDPNKTMLLINKHK